MMVVTVAGLVLAASGAVAAQSPPVTPLADEPRILEKAMARIEARAGNPDDDPPEGFFVEFGQMITGSGWISAGPGYRQYLFDRRAVLETSAAISWRAYKAAQATLEFPRLANNRLTAGGKVLWHDYTQVRYFGAGPHTSKEGISDYRVKAADTVAYVTWRPQNSVSLSFSGGVLSPPRLSASGGSFDRGDPDTLTLHAAEPGATPLPQPRFVHTDLSVVFDTRDQRSYPTRGVVTRAAWSTFRDQPGRGFSFDRLDTEAAYFQPLLGRGVLAARVWGVFSHTGEGNAVPFYLLAALGGNNTLRGFADYRFHDRHMLAANVETRWALFRHVDAALFFDAGNVAPRVGDLNLDRTSIGAGLRLHTSTSTLARFDVGHSAEGWRVMFKLSDPLRLSRVTKRTAPLPFVP